jgi:3-oxoacyl-[acyl-carrier-protein] synthase-1
MIYINAISSISTLGDCSEEICKALISKNTPFLLPRADLLLNHKTSYFGSITTSLPELKTEFLEYNSRNNRVLLHLVKKIEKQLMHFVNTYGPKRIGIVMGTSTSGILETETVMRNYLKDGIQDPNFSITVQELGSPSAFLAKLLHIEGPAYTISTACSSSSRAIISGVRMIKANLADAVIVGGADTLCRSTIQGFDAMHILSYDYCTPFASERHGINIGEAGGLMLLSKEKAPLYVKSYGESSDAYHVSSPHPQGLGAIAAMSAALAEGHLKAEDIGYINLHGTATKFNDAMEALAVNTVFKGHTPSSSTKHLTGHTLGAAGILEACILAYLMTSKVNLPPQDFTFSTYDPTLPDFGLIRDEVTLKKDFTLSNSFAFGGNNTAIILGRC